MSEFYGMNTDARIYEADLRRQLLTTSFARRPARDSFGRTTVWRRLTHRAN